MTREDTWGEGVVETRADYTLTSDAWSAATSQHLDEKQRERDPQEHAELRHKNPPMVWISSGRPVSYTAPCIRCPTAQLSGVFVLRQLKLVEGAGRVPYWRLQTRGTPEARSQVLRIKFVMFAHLCADVGHATPHSTETNVA